MSLGDSLLDIFLESELNSPSTHCLLYADCLINSYKTVFDMLVFWLILVVRMLCTTFQWTEWVYSAAGLPPALNLLF